MSKEKSEPVKSTLSNSLTVNREKWDGDCRGGGVKLIYFFKLREILGGFHANWKFKTLNSGNFS